MPSYDNLLNCLQSLLGVLELSPEAQLHQDMITICSYLKNATYRIAVFAPFNHGKSTLLNALLGKKTLPIYLIPTTGAAISVGYGEYLASRIVFQDGTKIEAEGTKILEQYAILDNDRRMRLDIAEVKVFCDHPWLKTGVEFLDLPGTNDREAQNDLVRDKLLGADLIIHVLDARKLMTLEERENLTNWLHNRGIDTVVFVVNFLNLLTSKEQQEVRNRLCFVAESFRSDLPGGISNIYCVNALPALRARLKGNQTAAQTTGLTSFESALQHIASSKQGSQSKLSRVFKMSQQLLERAKVKQHEIAENINSQKVKADKQTEVKRKAEQLIQQRFGRSISDFQGWLYLPKLLTTYQASLAIALQQTRFDRWLELEFQPDVFQHQQAINQWTTQGCEFFQHQNPELLNIDFPHPPTIPIPEYIPNNIDSTSGATINLPSELNFILRTKVGTVVLGGASYVLNKVSSQSTTPANFEPNQAGKISSQVYADVAEAYLRNFSDRTNITLSEYEKIASQYISFIPQAIPNQTSNENYQLQLLNNLINNFEDELNKLRSAI